MFKIIAPYGPRYNFVGSACLMSTNKAILRGKITAAEGIPKAAIYPSAFANRKSLLPTFLNKDHN